MTKLPEFKSLEDETEYWETHSIAPYWDSLEDVEFEVETSNRGSLLVVPVDKNQLKQLIEHSVERGVSFHQLMEKMIENYVRHKH